MRLFQAWRNLSRHKRGRLETLQARLDRYRPTMRLQQLQQSQQELSRRLHQAMNQQLNHYRQKLAVQSRALETVSPLATLGRGYAIVSAVENDKVLHQSNEVAVGDRIRARLHQGQLLCRVEEIENETA